MKKLFCILSASLFLVSACQKNKLSEITRNKVFHKTLSFEEIMKINNIPSDGVFGIQEFSGIAGGTFLPHAISISGGFIDRGTNSPKAVNGEVSFHGIELQKSPDYKTYFANISPVDQINNLFGRKIAFSINYPLLRNNTLIEDSFYVPIQIRLDFPGFIPFGASADSILDASELKSGQIIQWNKDTANHLGVLLFVEYFPDDAGNGNLKNSGYNQHTSNGILVDDVGKFTLTQELFQDVPIGARIRVSIARGGFLLATDPTSAVTEFKLYAYSVQQDNFKLASGN